MGRNDPFILFSFHDGANVCKTSNACGYEVKEPVCACVCMCHECAFHFPECHHPLPAPC